MDNTEKVVICIDTAFYMKTIDDDKTSWFDKCCKNIELFLKMALFENKYIDKIDLVCGCEKVDLVFTNGCLDPATTMEKFKEMGLAEATDNCLESWISSVPSAFSEDDLVIGFTAFLPPIKDYHFKNAPNMMIIDLSHGEPSDINLEQRVYVHHKNLHKLFVMLHYTIMSNLWTSINVGHALLRGTVESNEEDGLLPIDCINVKGICPSSLLEGVQVKKSGYFYVQTRFTDEDLELFSDKDGEILQEFGPKKNLFSYDCFLDFVYSINLTTPEPEEDLVMIADGKLDGKEVFIMLRPKFFNVIDGRLVMYNRLEYPDPNAEQKPEDIVEPVEVKETEDDEMEEEAVIEMPGPQEKCDVDEFYTIPPRTTIYEEGEQDEVEYLADKYRVLEVLIMDKPAKTSKIYKRYYLNDPFCEPISYNSEAISANINRMIRALRKLPERRGLFEKEIYNMREIVETSQNCDYAYQFARVLQLQSYGPSRYIVSEAARASKHFEYMGNMMQ